MNSFTNGRHLNYNQMQLILFLVCLGDQGGALVSYESGEPVVIGIASWVLLGCSQPKNPGVFARTSAALEWIHTHTQIEVY